ncbi:unnamed protein product [Macrosiphum euphorbiae]|uniref:Suppressor of forked domain-containing protein n=1 Tax=Macrosiphum euphorbiae TaxID=13131 RepID=A0AAV0X853_9HEMI|nr:unnamed protein product [Macrosiphum euphorbiae]
MRPQAAQAVISSDDEFELDVIGNIDSDASSSESEEDSDQDEEDEPVVKKLRKLTKAQRHELQKIKEDAEKIFDEEKIPIAADPQNPDHFERLLLSNPNSSFIWTKYMALHANARDFEKAREVGKRAASAINTREEQEKLIVWTTLFEFEEVYGTKESFKQTMNEALLSNSEYKIACLILEMCVNLKRIKGLEHSIKKRKKEFSDSIDAYLQCVLVYFTLRKTAKARLLLQKALSNLPTKSHVTMISEFAWMENNHGSPEEAQTLFEDILTCYPSRIDIWKLYVDMLIKSNKMDLARHAFERAAIQQQVAPEKMTRLFAKWMMFEEKYGTPESIRKVQESLFNYIQT